MGGQRAMGCAKQRATHRSWNQINENDAPPFVRRHPTSARYELPEHILVFAALGIALEYLRLSGSVWNVRG